MIEGRLAYADDLTRVFRQVVGVVLVSWQCVLRVGLITAALALAMAEIVASVLTSSFPPPAMTHLIAVALALATGYGVALTMLLAMLLSGCIRFIRHLEGEVDIGAHAAGVFARREAGHLGALFGRILSASGTHTHTGTLARIGAANRRPGVTPRPAVPARGAPSAAVAAIGMDVARAAVRHPRATTGSPTALPYNARPDVRRDPDDAMIRASAPALPSLPVPAARLPRIEWTYDDVSPAMAATYAAPAAQYNAVPSVPVLSDEPASERETAPPPPPESTATPEASPSGASEEPGRTPDVPGLIPRGFYPAGSTTRPLPAITRPLSADTQPLRVPGGVRSGGLWERVSQALVGQPESSESGDEGREDESLSPGEVVPEDAWLNG